MLIYRLWEASVRPDTWCEWEDNQHEVNLYLVR